MIVIHSSLVSSPPEDEPLNYPTMGWRNIVTAGNISADSEASGYPADNLANPATHLYWQAGAGGQEYVTIDTSGQGSIDYLAIAGHNFYEAGITVALEHNVGAGYVSLIAAQTLPDSAPVIFRVPPASNRTGMRINLAAGTSPAVAPRAAVIYVGKLTIFERGVQGDFTPLNFGRVNTVANGESENGNFLGRIVTGSRAESSARFRALSSTWYRQNLSPFVDVSVNTPFFFAWMPVEFPNETGYAWLSRDPIPILDALGYVHIELPMTGIIS